MLVCYPISACITQDTLLFAHPSKLPLSDIHRCYSLLNPGLLTISVCF